MNSVSKMMICSTAAMIAGGMVVYFLLPKNARKDLINRICNKKQEIENEMMDLMDCDKKNLTSKN